jgi:hypothetical protein
MRFLLEPGLPAKNDHSVYLAAPRAWFAGKSECRPHAPTEKSVPLWKRRRALLALNE